jgi:hypothetical protein
VKYELLTHKLHHIDFADPLLLWINSFLCKRTQLVLYKSFISTPLKVTWNSSGDHFFPLFFDLFINDVLFSITNSCILLFVDEAKIYKSNSSHDNNLLLQKDLIKFNEWCFL